MCILQKCGLIRFNVTALISGVVNLDGNSRYVRYDKYINALVKNGQHKQGEKCRKKFRIFIYYGIQKSWFCTLLMLFISHRRWGYSVRIIKKNPLIFCISLMNAVAYFAGSFFKKS